MRYETQDVRTIYFSNPRRCWEEIVAYGAVCEKSKFLVKYDNIYMEVDLNTMRGQIQFKKIRLNKQGKREFHQLGFLRREDGHIVVQSELFYTCGLEIHNAFDKFDDCLITKGFRGIVREREHPLDVRSPV